MEPITATAIVAALAAGAVSGATSVGKKVLVDGYTFLKDLLTSKFGPESDVVEAVEKLEQQPDRDDRKATVDAELKVAKADQDPDIEQAARKLLEQITAQPGGEERIQIAQGSFIAQADRGSTATVHVGKTER